MPTIKWKNLIAQERVKDLFNHAFSSGTLGHAYLFCGERGVGKFAAAVDLAMAVLCQCGDPNKARPCGECPSCRKAAAYSHPDLHVIMPLCLSAEHKRDDGALSEEGWALAAAGAKARMGDPYVLPRYDGIPNIPVDWVREADHAVMRGAVEGASGVAIIDGVDTMRRESANAMLKTLEEPPPGTLLLLLTDRVHGVLPTILSRCQTVRFPLLPPEVIGAELCRRFKIDGGADELGGGLFDDDGGGAGPGFPESVAAAASAGSLGIAISEYENPLDEYYGYAASLWGDCLRGDWGAAAAAADGLSSGKDSYNVCRSTVSCLVRLMRTAVLKKFGRGGASINYITSGDAVVERNRNDRADETSGGIEIPAAYGPGELSTVVGLAQGALSGLDARGNAALVMAGLVCSLMEALNVEKQ